MLHERYKISFFRTTEQVCKLLVTLKLASERLEKKVDDVISQLEEIKCTGQLGQTSTEKESETILENPFSSHESLLEFDKKLEESPSLRRSFVSLLHFHSNCKH
jgi:hypothetical protein